MKCPICANVDLLMTERQTVEIDYCPQCRGIWLDRGELEKIIDRSMAVSSDQPLRHYKGHDDDDDHDRHNSGGGFGDGKQRRKRSMLGELFDF